MELELGNLARAIGYAFHEPAKLKELFPDKPVVRAADGQFVSEQWW